ncbi:porin [Castellaniella sp. GW247-6E4]|uniref:porin n=1 Tax=Castellaniella sp. GW247-6E4 TaxID=3140380 RepID=UPI003316108D
MKKTLLAAALIVGFAGVAQAETSVTMYGILDTGYGYSNFKYSKDGISAKRTSSGLTSGIVNGNRWGVRGSEDLGDGLRAIFTLEAGFDINTGKSQQGDDAFFGRQAYVGLASDNWGTLTMGRQYNVATGMTYANNLSVSMGDMDKAFGSQGLGSRMDNSFKYVTPNFSGFTAGVAYGNPKTTITRVDGTSVGSSDRSNWLSTGLNYANGPLAVGASYDRASLGGGQENAITNWALSGSYDFEVVKLALAYGQDRHGKLGWGELGGDTGMNNGLATNAYFQDFKSNNYYVGLSAPVGTGTLAASWSRSDSNLDDADKLGDDAKAQNIYHLNYKYPLSKRTTVYAYGSYGTGIAYIDGLKGKEAGVGLNHKF